MPKEETGATLGCPACKQRFSIEECLENCRDAWPNQGWIGFICPICRGTCKLELTEGSVSIGDIDGAPGPCFFPTETVSVPNLFVQKSGMFIFCTLDGRKFSFNSRQPPN